MEIDQLVELAHFFVTISEESRDLGRIIDSVEEDDDNHSHAARLIEIMQQCFKPSTSAVDMAHRMKGILQNEEELIAWLDNWMEGDEREKESVKNLIHRKQTQLSSAV